VKIISRTGREDIALVYVAEFNGGRMVELVESLQPPIPREKKWVLIVSTLFGCPIRCRFCDAGGFYQGKLSRDEIFEQIDYLIGRRYPDRKVPAEKFKIQFARMGEPSFNENVLAVLDEIPGRYDQPGLILSLSTIAPVGQESFFRELLRVKKRMPAGRFQFQVSLHTTDQGLRDWLVPTPKWDYQQIADYGKAFYQPGDRKIVLNFALVEGMPVDPGRLKEYFSPDIFFIKITPLNPTYAAQLNQISSHIVPEKQEYEIIGALQKAGYEVLLSIGEWEENKIGSNCGQYLLRHLSEKEKLEVGYNYPVKIY
jgi:23S rRNA (adenine2503-C2)-methyltransferase